MRTCAPSQTQWEEVLLCDTYRTIWGRTETTCFWDKPGSFHIFLPPGCFLLLPLDAAGIIFLMRNQLLFLKPIIGKLVWGNNSSLGTFNKCTTAKNGQFGTFISVKGWTKTSSWTPWVPPLLLSSPFSPRHPLPKFSSSWWRMYIFWMVNAWQA